MWDGTCSVFSDAPAAPLCAPQTAPQPAATFTAPISIRPPASPASFKILRWKHGGASRDCIWAKCASRRQRLSARESECTFVPRLQLHSALLGEISYWIEDMRSVARLQLCPRTVIIARICYWKGPGTQCDHDADSRGLG